MRFVLFIVMFFGLIFGINYAADKYADHQTNCVISIKTQDGTGTETSGAKVFYKKAFGLATPPSNNIELRYYYEVGEHTPCEIELERADYYFVIYRGKLCAGFTEKIDCTSSHKEILSEKVFSTS